MKATIQIPAVGSVPAFDLDPDNRAQVSALILRADALFRLSAKAWERGNNSGNPLTFERETARERSLARDGEAILRPLGITCDWPGLYPSFKAAGYHEYTTEAAVLSALGKPRNWLRKGGAS